MRAEDVTATLDLALAASGLDQVTVLHRPRLLTDNGSSYIAGDLATWLEGQGMTHIRGAPRHPQTQGKIERWHQTLKNRILLENHYLPGALEEQIGAFIERYNHARPHESLSNLTPATSTSAAARPSSPSGPGSSVRPSPPAACTTTHAPPKPHP